MVVGKIIEGILWGLFAQMLTFYQLQGQFIWEFNKRYPWLIICLGIPISFMFTQSVKAFVEAFGGQIWPSRLIGFGIGAIVFAFMSVLIFKEALTLKTITCLFLGLCIILIQILWK